MLSRSCLQSNHMEGLYIIFGGMILFATVVVIYDRLARREQRKSA